MKLVTKIFLLILIFLSFANAQSQDTTKISLKNPDNQTPHNYLIELQTKLDDFELHRQLYNMQSEISLENDPQTVWLKTSFLLFQSDNHNSDEQSNLLLPLYNQYLEKSRFDPVRYVLGMAQAGAVGYLAYKHIKKYGFFK